MLYWVTSRRIWKSRYICKISKSQSIWHGLAGLVRLAGLAGLAARNSHSLRFSQNFYIAITEHSTLMTFAEML